MARAARTVAFAANPLLKVKLPAWRSKVAVMALAAAFGALVLRAVWLQVVTDDFLQRQGEVRYARTLELPATRGRIMDRNGTVLATSLPAKSIWAIPEDVEAPPEKLVELAKLLGVPQKELRAKLGNEDRKFVYLHPQVENAAAERIAALGIPGVHQRRTFKRFWPEGETLAHVVGFTNQDGIGQEGIELAQQEALAGRAGSRRVIKDRLGRVIEDVRAVNEPHDGRDLFLSIDTKVQYLTFNAMRDTVDKHRAKAAAAVVVDVQTGEVLALVNLPTYNPNDRGQLTGAQLRNRALTDTFEPGSTMKAFSIAMGLDSGRFSPQTVVQTAPGKLTIGTATIGDAHPHGALTVEQVLQKSSNVGTAKIALSQPPQRMWEMFTAAGFGQVPSIGFPGAVAGRLRPAKGWRPIEQATMSYGHGISVSLIQMARAYTVFARDGDMIPLTFQKNEQPAAGVQVFKPETARAVRKMLEMAAGPEGTAPQAQIPGYRVAGKTGTAHKIVGGAYANKYVSSFIGFAPASKPRVVIAVMVDEPTTGGYYGGLVAAPAFARIASDVMRALRVEPDAPFQPPVMPAAPVQEST
jgi:cell division protein FtsI (penicillin-binding protein 3)